MRGLTVKPPGGEPVFVRHECDLAYVIQAVGNRGVVKVGRSTDPARRIGGLTSGVPFEIRTVAILSDGNRRERMLKSALAATKVRGEWFEPSGTVNDLLADAHRDNAVLQKLKVDAKFYKDHIEPIALEYLNGREPAHTYGGDLIFRMLREGFEVYQHRVLDVLNALVGKLTPEVAAGFVPLSLTSPAPRIVLDAGSEQRMEQSA